MFSFVGDTVLDPFMGTASTQIAAARTGRSSIGVEVDPVYFEDAVRRVRAETSGMFNQASIEVVRCDLVEA
jgi:DNA modification methylase